MFFNGWHALLRIFVVGICSYIALVVLLRVYGKRSLAKMNAFDFVVTVALGSTLATILLSKDVVLAEGVLAFVLLLSLQFAVTWLSLRVGVVRRLVKSEPRLLFYNGTFMHRAMAQERVAEGEVRSAVREQGLGAMEDVEAVVLETSGTISAIRKANAGSSSLEGVEGYEGRLQAPE